MGTSENTLAFDLLKDKVSISIKCNFNHCFSMNEA